MRKTPTAALQYFKKKYPGGVYSWPQIREALQEYRDAAGRGVNPQRFLEALRESGITEVEIRPDTAAGAKEYRPFIRYVRPDATAMDVARSLKNGGYFSHGSAALLHGLSGNPDAVYWNKEQSPKPEFEGSLTQRGIDRAFSSYPRKSKYIFSFAGQRIVLLNGKNTGDYGVTEHASGIRVTSIERTLFDIAVRPAYAGGPEAVLEAYKTARSRISLRKLLRVIRHVGHLYPYHQAIGFYLAAAGFKAKDLVGFRDLGLEFRFYLANKIERPHFDEEWKVYVPDALARGDAAARKTRKPRST